MADINQAKKYVNMTDLNPPLAQDEKSAETKRRGD
jgi:hypothetical protein